MVRDAEAHAEEDRQRKEEAEARNQADTMVYQTERMIREDESEAKRLTADEKERLEEAIKHLKDSLKGFDLAKVKADTEALALVTQTVSARLYAEATAAADDGAGAAGGGGPRPVPARPTTTRLWTRRSSTKPDGGERRERRDDSQSTTRTSTTRPPPRRRPPARGAPRRDAGWATTSWPRPS